MIECVIEDLIDEFDWLFNFLISLKICTKVSFCQKKKKKKLIAKFVALNKTCVFLIVQMIILVASYLSFHNLNHHYLIFTMHLFPHIKA